MGIEFVTRSDLTPLDVRLTEAEVALDDLAVRLAEAERRITTLEGGTEPEEPPPPTEPTTTVFGASDGVWPIPGVTKLSGIRAFLGPGDSPSDWHDSWELRNAIARTAPGAIVWFSWKERGTSWLDSLCASLKSDPESADRRYILTYNHEPENDSPPDPGEYQATWAAQLPVIHKNGFLAATCLLGHMSDAQNEPFHVDGVDIAGFDRYNPGLGHASRYADPVDVFRRCLAYARSKGLPTAFGETGTIIVDGTTSAARADWGRRVKAHLAAQPDVECVLWWNQSRMAIDSNLSTVWF